jgi:hypothetical protein
MLLGQATLQFLQGMLGTIYSLILHKEASKPEADGINVGSSATIYAYDIIRRPGQLPFLANKHVFAIAFRGVPAAITCDPAGNVYAACADGVEVWNLGGTALGLIRIPGTAPFQLYRCIMRTNISFPLPGNKAH